MKEASDDDDLAASDEGLEGAGEDELLLDSED